jgi:quercetin dioxygenase-like cupin family protein
MQINPGRARGLPSELRSSTFTGTVWIDPVLGATDGVMVNNVFFAPGARTHWHRHERGQVLVVTSGEGRACTRGGEVQPIRAGDVVFFPPGEEHWHGGSPDSYVLHVAVSLGETDWLEPVADGDYRGAEA